jgi:glycosyltransferase involved in cell wall biosynthesis/GT2 family glycosyltransferase
MISFLKGLQNVYAPLHIQLISHLDLLLQSDTFSADFNQRSLISLEAGQLISSTFIEDYLAWKKAENNPDLSDSDFYNLQKVKSEKENLAFQFEQLEFQLKFQFNYTYPQLYQTQLELQQTHAQLTQTALELQQTYGQLHQTNLKAQQAEAQSQRIASLLQGTQSELQQTKSELQQTKSELQQTQSSLQQTQSNLHDANEEINAMKTSKFWKLRNKWFKVKKCLGLGNEEDNNAITVDLTNDPEIPEIIVSSEEIPIAWETMKQEQWLKDNPLVTVVIPCFNYGQYLEDAIDSVLNQTLKDVEIIVVDDGSTESQTLAVLDKLNQPRTRIIRQENQKLPIARNNGIKNAKGKYICCLDADDKLKPTYLEKCVARMEAENLDICYSWLQEFGNSHEIRPSLDFRLETLIQYNGVIVSAVFKRDIWEKIGGYNPQMTQGYEDWDFWIAIAKFGGIGAIIKEPLFLYRKHGHSAFDEALAKHDLLYTQIQANHRDLYDDPEVVTQIFKQQKHYVVKEAYRNLLASFQKEGVKEPTHRQNILFALPCIVTGGAEKVLLNLVKMLKKEGFGITIFITIQTPPSMGDNTPKFEEFTNEIYHLYNFFDSSKWEEFICYLVESRNIDLIFLSGSSYFYGILPKIKQRFPNIKVIDQQYNEIGHMDNNRLYAEQIDMNIVENEAVKDCLLFKYQEKAEKVVLIPNGVDTEYFDPELVLEKTIDINENILAEKFIVTFLGRFSIEKAPQIFVEIVNHLKDNNNLYFIMAGNGILYDEVISLIHNYELTDKIYLPSFVDARECLSISNLLILPSQHDGRPNAVLEALSMGVPVIASSVGGLPQIIQDGYNGFLCQPSDAEDFVGHIQTLSNDANLYSQMQKNARIYAEDHLNLVTKTKQQYLTVFDHLFQIS